MLTEGDLADALARAGLSAPVRFEPVTGSTNDVGLDLAERGAPEWTLVAAGHQTGGRGRLGRTWEDRPGRALLVSVILRPEGLAPGRAGLLTLLAGASAAAAARETAGVAVRCKWPNDLVVEGAKVGGILAESSVASDRIRHVVVGLGVNLEAPAGVEGAGGIGAADPAALLAAYVASLRAAYRPAAPGFGSEVREAWRAVADTLGREVEAAGIDGGRIRGIAVDVDETGGLVLETPAGPVSISSGEVEHLR